jgi:hypothetical protein
MREIEFYTIQGSKMYILFKHTHTHVYVYVLYCKSKLQYMLDHKGHNIMSHTL